MAAFTSSVFSFSVQKVGHLWWTKWNVVNFKGKVVDTFIKKEHAAKLASDLIQAHRTLSRYGQV